MPMLVSDGANFSLLGWVDMLSAIILTGSGLYFGYVTQRGMGYKARPHGPSGPPEENWISAIISVVCGIMYFAKALDFWQNGDLGFQSAFSLNKIWYLDYLVTCPLIILDFAITLDLPHKIIWFITTAVLLTLSIASFLVAWPYRLYYYLFGCASFGLFFYALQKNIRAIRHRIPEPALPWLDRACYVFFGMWPLFPLLWPFNFQNLQIIDEETYFIIHSILDITCKAVFGYVMLHFRLTVEDIDNDKIEAEEAEEANAAKADPELGRLKSVMTMHNMEREDSQLISRARRNQGLMKSEKSVLFGRDEMRQMLMMQKLQNMIEDKTMDAQRGMVRQMTETFDKKTLKQLMNLEDDEEPETALQAKLIPKRKSRRPAAAPKQQTKPPTPSLGGAAASPKQRQQAWRMPSFSKAFDTDDSSSDEGEASAGAATLDRAHKFDGAITKPKNLHDIMSRRDFALGKLSAYQGKADAEDVLICCGYKNAAEFDEQSFTVRYAMKKARGKPDIEAILSKPKRYTFSALVRMLESTTRFGERMRQRQADE